MENVKVWFNELPRREQIILLALSLVLVVYFWIAVVMRPMDASLASAKQANTRSLEILENAKLIVAEISQLRGQAGQQAGADLSQVANTTATNIGLRMSRFQPGATGVNVRLDSVSPKKVFNWLHTLEFQYGVKITELSVTPGRSGGVNVNVKLKK